MKVLLVIIITFLFVSFARVVIPTSSPAPARLHSTIFFDAQTFLPAITADKKLVSLPSERQIKGGIVPHHLLASSMIADFFYQLSTQDLEAVIIIGPNHAESGLGKSLSSNWNWGTPQGTVEVDQHLVNELVKAELVALDPETLNREHSVAGLMPFVREYLPDAKVVPIILTSQLTQEDIEKLTVFLDKYRDRKIAVVGSIDFSHYLTPTQAAQRDNHTLKLIKENNLTQIKQLNSEYLDSAPALVLLLSLMQSWQKEFILLENKNSFFFVPDNSLPTTSYIEAIFF